MDLRQLRYFLSIVERGSFSRAAETLNIAQPALSLHVRNMEEDLGVQLLFRGPRGVTTTEAGDILFRRARSLLDQVSQIREEIIEHEAEPSGVVHLGLPVTISENLSVPLLLAAQKRYPKVQLQVAEAMSGFVLDWVRDLRVDFAILYIPVTDRKFDCTRVLEEDLWLLGPPGPMSKDIQSARGAVNFEQIAKLPLVLPSESHGLRTLMEKEANRLKLKLGTVLEIDSYSNIKGLVEAGVGYSILPFNAIAREVSAGRLLAWKIKDPGLSRFVYIVKPSDRPLSNAARSIYGLVNETINTLVDNGKWNGVRKEGAVRGK
ncbi:MAG: LysR family transcriptional regulator [Sneathiella sp.]|nr:MAG: LysR family transcriptional regulator [Sneathiella sp.]